jgi:Na+/H+-dicarboxylate symporter/ABC-type amino acid transport substrate-binding protein
MSELAVAPQRKWKFNLTHQILLGLVLGISTGLFFGERAAALQIVGDAFIRLLQMTILPYIVCSLIANIGGLSQDQAKLMGGKIGVLLAIFWSLALVLLALVPMALPRIESANFFSVAQLEPVQSVDFLGLYIPSNPFGALAEQIVPAAVLFSICVGVAMIALPGKEQVIGQLQVFSKALVKISGFIAKLTPVGVFALIAAASGTFTIDQLEKIQAYALMHIVASLLLSFVVLPALVAFLTPLRFRDVWRASRNGLILGVTTANVFIALPLLIEGAKEVLTERKDMAHHAGSIDVALPIAFSFPNVGKLMMMIFVPFAAWFAGEQMDMVDYPSFLLTGLLSFFGSTTIAIPFLLDLQRLPADLFNLFMVTNVIDGRIASIGAVMQLSCLGLITASVSTYGWPKFNLWRILKTFAPAILNLALGIGALGWYFSAVFSGNYQGDRLIRELQSQTTADFLIVSHDPTVVQPASGSLEAIRERGELRIGVSGDDLPWSYTNDAGKLVGLSVDLYSSLANDLGVRAHFVLMDGTAQTAALADGRLDIAGISVLTPGSLLKRHLTDPFMDLTLAFVVLDHRRQQFMDLEWVQQSELTIGCRDLYYRDWLRDRLPHADIVDFEHPRKFFDGELDLDAIVMPAESGAAWSLLYPSYGPVIPSGANVRVPVCVPCGPEPELTAFVSKWLFLQNKLGLLRDLKDYWLYGSGARPHQRRWSIMEDVFGWGVVEPQEELSDR